MKAGRSSETATGARGTAALAVPGKATLTGGALREEAEAGVAGGGGGALPFADTIQASFGPRNDVGSIRAHVGGQASASAGRIGADAYATGNQIEGESWGESGPTRSSGSSIWNLAEL